MSNQTQVIHGDCLEVLRTLPDNSVDAVVTDPPYGLSFMGKKWDYDVPSVELWAECLRVLKPGGHLLAFAGTRTQHRMAVRIEDAGFEIRDMIMWCYGSGFPKSLDVSKAIDKAAGAEREVVGKLANPARNKAGGNSLNMSAVGMPSEAFTTAPATEAARQWQGWGTALKPSHEPLTFARKPLDLRAHCVYLAQYLTSQLCQYSASVKDAGPSSMSSPSASGAAMSGSALWTAVGRCNTPGDLFALMDTLPSGSVLPSTLSTVFSWLRTLDGLLQHESTFTTETASSLTTDLKTLNSLLLRSTQGITIAELTEPSGHGSSAELVACIFNGFDASLRSTLARFAHGNAIAKAQEHYLDAGVSPALEPITVARKPLVGTVAENVLEHGTGALNIDGCRIGRPDGKTPEIGTPEWGGPANKLTAVPGQEGTTVERSEPNGLGRWPANLIHDGSDDVVSGFPSQAGASAPVNGTEGSHPAKNAYGEYGRVAGAFHGDSGSAARFFYCAKASKADRDAGLEGFAKTSGGMVSNTIGQHMTRRDDGYQVAPRANHHPTVKPTALMRYLVRLVTPPGGTVLDPFTGSGSTGKAAKLEGFNFIGIEREAEYVEIARARIAAAQPEPPEPPTLFD